MSEIITPKASCANCGSALREGVSFCASCGHTMAHQIAPSLVPAGPPTKKGWGIVRILVIVFVIVPLFFVAAVTVALFIWASQHPPACACTLPPDPALVAAEFTSDYNALVVTDNADVNMQNSQDATTSIAGIQARLAAHKNFDNQVATLPFLSSVRAADRQKVLDTDNALEQVITQETANRSNTKNYNAVLATEQPLKDAFVAAVKQLSND